MNKLNLNPITAVIVTTLLIISLFVSSSVYAAEINDFRYTTECTTRGSGYNHRYSCTSEWYEHKLPSDFVYKVESLHEYPVSKNGSENQCNHVWGNYIELIPGTGIKAPQNLKTRSHAKSPKVDWKGHNLGARGWSKCVFEGKYTKFR